MTKKLVIGAALLALSTPVWAVTQAAPPAPPPPITPIAPISAEQHKLAAQLVPILNSEELTRAQIAKMINETLPKTLAATPAFVAMEKDHPGITNAFIDAMRPVIVDGTVSRLPSLWARLEPIYAGTFTTAELRTLLAFYTSPAGTRVIRAMGAGADYSRMLGDMIQNGNNEVTADGLRAGVQTGVAQVIRDATSDDMKAMQTLAASSAGKKLPLVNQQVQAVAVAWGNESDPALNGKVEDAVKGVLAKYMGKPAQ